MFEARRRPDPGARVISAAAFLGAIVSVYNYLIESSGIAGTPGAMLVIVTSALLCLLGFAMRARFRRLVAILALVLIAGTAFAGWLLESPTLVVAMGLAFLGWLVHGLFGPGRAFA
jgi:glucan phosphoethanolaminetransferase (alkaline phosphatase superfamily)